MRATILTLLLLILVALPAEAKYQLVQPVDSVDTVHFEVKQVVAPVSMIAAGSLMVGIKPFVRARKWVNQEIGIHRCAPYDDYLQYLPAVAYLGLEYTGLKCRRPLVDRVIVGATSAIIMTALTRGVKCVVHEQRPTGTRRNSFPSGHSATAFMGAELLRQEYGPWVGAAGYGVATAVGVMRILNGRHWLNDVVAGAGIGILSAKAGEWLLPFNRRWLGLNRRPGTALALVPVYEPYSQSFCVTMSMQL